MTAAIKYHVNPNTGRTGQCTASIKPCKYGIPLNQHFSTREAAAQAYERSMSKKTLPKGKTKKAPTLKNISVADFDPSEYTLFSNRKAREYPDLMGKALTRQFKHVEWLHDLYRQNADFLQKSDEASLSEDERYVIEGVRKHQKELLKDIPMNEAKLMGMTKEMQWCSDNIRKFQNNLDSKQKAFMARGFFRETKTLADTPMYGTLRIV